MLPKKYPPLDDYDFDAHLNITESPLEYHQSTSSHYSPPSHNNLSPPPPPPTLSSQHYVPLDDKDRSSLDIFWAPNDNPFDPFEVYDPFDPYQKWKEDFLVDSMGQMDGCNNNDGIPIKDSLKDPLYDPLRGDLPPIPLDPSPEAMEERFKQMYTQVPRVASPWWMYGLRIFACLLLAVALYCFCNGYQEVRFLEIVNKCLEGHHNPMCEGFMEPESTMNDYKSITVQEDMYADRVEWIPKEMSPAQEYVTLVSILARHPCQSLRCLDKLTAQIYGGNEEFRHNVSIALLPGSNNSTYTRTDHDLKDKIDDVLKSMDKFNGGSSEIRKEVIRKNKEYLTMADTNLTTFLPTRIEAPNYQRTFDSRRNMKVRDVNQHLQSLIPDDINDRKGVFISSLSSTTDLPERSDFLANSKSHQTHHNTLKDKDKTRGSECLSVVVAERFDCHPDEGATEEACLARGCCWGDLSAGSDEASKQHRGHLHSFHRPKFGVSSANISANSSSFKISPPFCFYPPSMTVYHAIHYQDTPTGQEALLQLLQPSGHQGDVTELRLLIDYETENRLRIQIMPSEGTVPTQPVLPLTSLSGPALSGVASPQQAQNQQYSVNLVLHNAGITVTRTNSSTTLFSTLGAAPLVYAKQFLQISSRLSSSRVFGLGEHLNGLLLDASWSRYTLWNADLVPVPGKNLYGSHPFYMVLEPDGKSHGVFFLNSNAMDAVLQPAPALTFHSTGGIMTIYVFTGPTPADVISQYTELIGRPAIPPYWALGYHQCRYNYGTLNRTVEVWQRTRDAGIPFDVQWNDLDYMKNNNDFTYDTETFNGLPEFVDELHDLGMHYVPIIDPGISGSESPGTYPPYDEGINMNVFIKDHTGTQPFIGKVWNSNTTVWPDFSHPRALYYWARQLVRYHGLVRYDGAWIDMNEPSNFLSGSFSGCNPADSLNEPPYVPVGLEGGKLYHHTVCGDAQQYIGKHYDLHNMYGLMEAVATNAGLKVVRGERPLVITRASFPSLGVWAGHWTGDVYSTWENLAASIADILNFSLFGVPLVGADICGFNGNTTASLCLRWMQLGAFYPFARNHNTDDAIDQDPVALGPDVVKASKAALTERYRMLPYLYTLFYLAHTTGATVARPLFIQFPEDPIAFTVETQFMWGDGLMIIPALSANVTEVQAYIPCKSIWYNYYSGARLDTQGGCFYITLPAPIDRVPLLIRGGSIIPTQTPNVTTTQSRENPYSLYVALNSAGEAYGQLYTDDGVSIDPVANNAFSLLTITASERKLVISSEAAGYKADMTLDGVRIMGVTGIVESVTVNGEPHEFDYDNAKQVLVVQDLKWNLPLYFVMRW